MTVTTLSADSVAGLAEPRADAFRVTVDKGMKLREGQWDAAVRRQQVWEWATGADGEVDLAKAARAHAIADLNPEGRDATREDLKLPIAGVEDGELVGIGNGIRNALAIGGAIVLSAGLVTLWNLRRTLSAPEFSEETYRTLRDASDAFTSVRGRRRSNDQDNRGPVQEDEQ